MMNLDPCDLNSLKWFFDEYDGMSLHELAILANTTPYTISMWKRKCNDIPVKKSKPKLHHIIAEEWDNKEWLQDAYENFGIRSLTKMIGKGTNYKFTYAKLNEYGIPIKKHSDRVKSDNPCKDPEWLNYYYSDRETYLNWCGVNGIVPCDNGGQALTLSECANMAGVHHQTIVNWLSYYKIKVRNNVENNIVNKKKFNVKYIRLCRDNFFESYRKGIVNIKIGDNYFSNGRVVK